MNVKRIGYIGLGKMGVNMVLHLEEQGIKVVAFNRGKEGRDAAKKKGVHTVDSIEKLVASLAAPRVVWLMVSHKGVDQVLKDLVPLLSKGDTVIDGGNCFYEETQRRAKLLARKGIVMLDAGVSGGPSGARTGACVMVGGDKKIAHSLAPLFKKIATKDAFLYTGKSGAGHFVKMVHNGIEYGMMQAIAEGFEVLKKSLFDLDLEKVSKLYNHRSVIESRLVGGVSGVFKTHGRDLKKVLSSVAHTGEGAWTIETAKKLGVSVKVIEESLKFRIQSEKKPAFAGKVLSALRNQFGGHDITGTPKGTSNFVNKT